MLYLFIVCLLSSDSHIQHKKIGLQCQTTHVVMSDTIRST